MHAAHRLPIRAGSQPTLYVTVDSECAFHAELERPIVYDVLQQFWFGGGGRVAVVLFMKCIAISRCSCSITSLRSTCETLSKRPCPLDVRYVWGTSQPNNFAKPHAAAPPIASTKYWQSFRVRTKHRVLVPHFTSITGGVRADCLFGRPQNVAPFLRPAPTPDRGKFAAETLRATVRARVW